MEKKVAGYQYGEEFCLENGNSGAKRKSVFFNDVVTVVDEPGPAILFRRNRWCSRKVSGEKGQRKGLPSVREWIGESYGKYCLR